MNMIDRLRSVEPGDRPLILEQLYKKNIAFLSQRFPDIVKLFDSLKCPYRIDLTESFLNIVHEPTNTLAHPEVGLDIFSAVLGDWVHDTWVDLFNFRVVAPDEYFMHLWPVKKLHRRLMVNFPEYPVKFAQKKVNLKELAGDRRFSPPVIFLGIFHGLHIDFFLSRTDVASILLVEPDAERFEVSCYFLDYEQLYERFDRVKIIIGNDIDSAPIRDFFSYQITPQMWLRILPAYESDKFPMFIESFKIHQTTLASVIYPIEHELFGLHHAEQNLTDKLPLLSRFPKLSKRSRIAVVATGPSLDKDLVWLKKNKSKMIIFAVASAVSALRANGIEPDFQITLEANLSVLGIEEINLAADIPMLAFLNANSDTVSFFKDKVYLCGSSEKASPVQLGVGVPYTSPSTTNFAISFACHCRPDSIYMLGADFGYFSLEQSHSASSYYDDIDEEAEGSKPSQAKSMSQGMVRANFHADKTIQTNPFLTYTRLNIEKCISVHGRGIKINNLSDGALVAGARAIRSSRVKLKEYKQKRKDVKKILQSFEPAESGKNWQPYPTSGQKLLQQMKKTFLQKITLEKFSWSAFCKAIDLAIFSTVSECRDGDNDTRMDIYSRLLIDLLATWYATIIFFDDIKRAEEVYIKGLSYITEEVEQLTWQPFIEPVSPDINEKFIGLFLRRDSHSKSKFAKITPCLVSATHGSTQLAGGELLMVGNDQQGDIACSISVDRGISWNIQSIICASDMYADVRLCEAHALEVGDGQIVSLLTSRAGQRKNGFIYQTRSSDSGKTWEKPQKTAIFGGAPHLLLLASGEVLLVFGHDRAPISLQYSLSKDKGMSWSEPQLIISFEERSEDLVYGPFVKTAYAEKVDFGYPSSFELDDGSISTAFYGPVTGDVNGYQVINWVPVGG